MDELTHAAYAINAQLLTKPFPVFIILAGIYFIVCFLLARLIGWVERRLRPLRSLFACLSAMDPLEVLKKALSAPQGSDEQRTVLGQLRTQLEAQPGLIHPLCTMLVPTIANASDSLMKRWVIWPGLCTNDSCQGHER